MRKIKNKHGVSEMISYVLLVAITVMVSIGVYAWMKYQIPSCNEDDADCFIPLNCPDDTSIMIDNYKCGPQGLDLVLVNNGRFNISGVIVAVTNDSTKIPNYYLTPRGSGKPGEITFGKELGPGNEVAANFSWMTNSKTLISLDKIEKIQMQPYLLDGKKKTICKNIIIRETLKSCSKTSS
ncbi:hypothetical protein J4218_06380 [Candidatus Pacearchaeota archaeon]|nr:hypothetical protein [Candidatus Pacearchaeota archaeon]